MCKRANFHERHKLDCTQVAYSVLCTPIMINYKCNLKCIFIIKFEIKMFDICHCFVIVLRQLSKARGIVVTFTLI